MRVIAILATYNEERFISGCLENLVRQGVQAYLIDNDSTDDTVTIAKRYIGQGLIGIERLPRAGVFSLRQQLARKETLAATLDADWFIHMDADQILLPPASTQTLAQALAMVDAKGFNAVNFNQFAFVPTKEEPDHDHENYQLTMRWYYPMESQFPYAVRAWKRQQVQVDLSSSGGHHVRFPDLRLYPISFRYRHYLFLSVGHARRKYMQKQYDRNEIADGWHVHRVRRQALLRLPFQSELRFFSSDDELDYSEPKAYHVTNDLALDTAEISGADLEALRAAHSRAEMENQRLREVNAKARSAAEKALAAAEAARAEVDALRASTSWRFTAPLRSISSRLRR